MFFKKFHKSFHTFVFQCVDFNDIEKEKIHNVFKEHTIKKIFNLAIMLLIWSFVALWIDTILISKGVLSSASQMMLQGNQFYPILIFFLINTSLKFIFIYFYTKCLKSIKKYEILLGVIPYAGSLLILGSLLSHEREFFIALKKYLKYIRKNRKWVELLSNKR